MLKAMIEKIEKMAAPHFYEHDGCLYYDDGKEAKVIDRADVVDRSFRRVESLDALISLIKNEYGEDHERRGFVFERPGTLYVSVVSPTKVCVYTSPVTSGREGIRRLELFEANASDVPGFTNTEFEYEQAIIALRSRFAPNEGSQYVLDLMSNLTVENSVQTEDDGVTQHATVRSGIAMCKTVEVKPIVSLRPYRTFQEVQQPESLFLIRLGDKRRLSITEADGGMWRLDARKTIAEYLKSQFADEIAAGRIVVML